MDPKSLNGFIHAVGIDVHQKLILTKVSNLNLNNKRGKVEPSSFAPPAQEVCVIEDGEETTSQARIEKVHSSTKSKMVDDSM